MPDLMKDGLGREAVDRIAASLDKTIPGFSNDEFTRQAMSGLSDLELKDRVRHLVSVLNSFLSDDFIETSEVLLTLKTTG